MSSGRRRVIFVGLGKMGEHLAGHVHAGRPPGWAMAVCDVDRERATALAKRWDVPTTFDLAGTITAGDVVCLSVPDGRVVGSILTSLTESADLRDTTVLDFSSVSPAQAVEFAGLCAGAGGAYFDCPVTGGVVGAEAGTLTIMVGGSDAFPAELDWVLDSFGRHVVRTGAPGNGAVMKTLSNMVGNVSAMVSMEAITLAKLSGVDDEVILDVLNNGPGRTYYSEVRYPRYVQTGQFNAGMRLGLVVKDLDIALGHAERLGAQPAVCSAGAAQWRQAAQDNGPEADTTTSIRTVASAMAGVTWDDVVRGDRRHNRGS